MPTIQLESDNRNAGRVLAVMLYPEDQSARTHYEAVSLADFETKEARREGLRGSAQIRVSLDLLNALVDARSHREIAAEAKERTKRALLASWVLSGLYIMVRHRLEDEPSVNKAIAGVSAYAATTTYRDGSPVSRSEPAIRAAIKEFGPVLHLWSAFSLHESFPIADTRAPLVPPHLGKFLQVSAGLLEFAFSFRQRRVKRQVSLIPKDRAWVPPEPFRSSPLDLPQSAQRIPNRMQDFLRHYRAPRSA